jgi:hypothetical protein
MCVQDAQVDQRPTVGHDVQVGQHAIVEPVEPFVRRLPVVSTTPPTRPRWWSPVRARRRARRVEWNQVF